MADGSKLATGSLIEKVTLLAVADLARREETPVYPFEVRSAVRACIDPLADDVIGMPDEAAVSRALNALEADNLVAIDDAGERSPVGKGRPAYGLRGDPRTVFAGIAEDERLAAAVERVRPDPPE